jgi:hypothetical protein
VLDDGAARKRFAAGSDLTIYDYSKGYFCANVSGSVRVYWLLFFIIPILQWKVSERLHWILFQLKFIWLSRSRGSEVRDTANAVLTRENVAIIRCIPSHVVLYPICRLGIADSRQIPNLEDRNRRQNQSKVPALFAAIICAFSINVQADNGKIISSAICQAMTPNGAEHLRHLGSSLQAVGADVTVICPIVRDSMGGRMKWVDVRHRRPSGAGGEQVSGRVYSCDATYGGCYNTAQSYTDTSNTFTSVFLDTGSLPFNSDHYFYYRSVLPENWKIVASSISRVTTEWGARISGNPRV